ncbi:MAG: HupE / UreJ protein [Bacteroidetes bacterium]|nr:MAG: HupE / UreJ protein [Bacteroidota bacterium]
MIEDFWFNMKYGINHVLDINAYDHVLFLIVLTIPYLFKDWKRVLLLVSLFTLGHTLSLVLAAYNVVSINGQIVEFLIPITILIVALFNVFTSGKNAQKEKIGVLFLTTLFFGLVHGLGFASEFKILVGRTDSKLATLIEFALGIEVSQVIIVSIVLFLGYILQTLFNVNKRNYVMVISAIVVGLVIPMILQSDFLN